MTSLLLSVLLACSIADQPAADEFLKACTAKDPSLSGFQQCKTQAIATHCKRKKVMIEKNIKEGGKK